MDQTILLDLIKQLIRLSDLSQYSQFVALYGVLFLTITSLIFLAIEDICRQAIEENETTKVFDIGEFSEEFNLFSLIHFHIEVLDIVQVLSFHLNG